MADPGILAASGSNFKLNTRPGLIKLNGQSVLTATSANFVAAYCCCGGGGARARPTVSLCNNSPVLSPAPPLSVFVAPTGTTPTSGTTMGFSCSFGAHAGPPGVDGARFIAVVLIAAAAVVVFVLLTVDACGVRLTRRRSHDKIALNALILHRAFFLFSEFFFPPLPLCLPHRPRRSIESQVRGCDNDA